MNELALQTFLVAAAKAEGGYGLKISHRLLIGVLDLYVQLRGFPGAWLEIKLDHKSSPDAIARVGLTPHQRRSIIEIGRAGGCVGWVMARELSPGKVMLRCGVDPHITTTSMAGSLIRERGTEWPIREVVKQLIQLQL